MQVSGGNEELTSFFPFLYRSNSPNKSGASSLLGNVLGYGTHYTLNPLPKNLSLASKMVEKAELYPFPQVWPCP